MAVITNKEKAMQVNSVMERGPMVMCIGKSTQWESPYSDDYPEPEVSSISLISDAIAYKNLGTGPHAEDAYQSVIAFARPDANGTVEYRGSTYSLTYDLSTALNDPDGPYTALYIKAVLIESEMPTNVSFRKIGIFSDTVGTFDENNIALPEDIESAGMLRIVDYRKPIYRASDQSEVIELIIPY